MHVGPESAVWSILDNYKTEVSVHLGLRQTANRKIKTNHYFQLIIKLHWYWIEVKPTILACQSHGPFLSKDKLYDNVGRNCLLKPPQLV